MKKSRTVTPPIAVEFPTARRLPLVDLLVDAQSGAIPTDIVTIHARVLVIPARE